MLPQRNAQITKIERVGGSTLTGWTEDYERAATDPEAAAGEGKDRWAGRRGCYWIERRRRLREGQTTNLVVERSVLIDTHFPEQFESGDTIHVDHRGVAKRGKVQAVEDRRMPGVRGSIRLTLDDERAA